MSSKISVPAVSWWQIGPGITLFKHPLRLMSSKPSVFAVSWQQTIPGTTLFKQPLRWVALLLAVASSRMQGHGRKVFGHEPCMICTIRLFLRKNFDALRAKKERLRNVKTRGKKGKGQLSPGGRTANSKTVDVVAEVGVEVVAGCGAAITRIEVPRAAA